MNKIEIYDCLSNILGKDLNNNIKINNKYFLSVCAWNNEYIIIPKTYSEKCKVAIELFKLHFENYFDEIIVATSLYIDCKKLKGKTLEYDLSSKGYLLPILKNIFDSKDSINDHIFSELSSSFRYYKHTNYQEILDLSFLMMGSEILPENSGYLFFILPKFNLIIYPHSDIGYGAFCIDLSKGKDLWKKFEENSKEYFTVINQL